MTYPDDFINKVIQGDCLQVMPAIADKSIDMILCDLPYGTTACKWDTIIPFEPLWEQYKRIIKDNGVILLFGSEPFSSKLRLSNLEQYRYDWIWDKVNGANFLNIKNRPLKTHEQVLVFSKTPGFTFNPIRTSRSELSLKRDPTGTQRKVKRGGHKVEHYNFTHNTEFQLEFNPDGKKHPIDIIRFNSLEKGCYKFKHPTKKPLKLAEYLIKTYTNEGDLVLDNCVGSGTTGVACKRLNRRFILIEQEEKYCKVARDRLNNEAEPLFKEPLFK
jgi:site-specific DNA-methyltransferase (adenine-specific)